MSACTSCEFEKKSGKPCPYHKMSDAKKAEIAKFKGDRRAEQRAREAAAAEKAQEFAKQHAKLTDEQLDALMQQKSAAIEASKAELRALAIVKNSRMRRAAAEKVVEGMTPDERAQFLVDVGAIASGEQFGSPKAK